MYESTRVDRICQFFWWQKAPDQNFQYTYYIYTYNNSHNISAIVAIIFLDFSLPSVATNVESTVRRERRMLAFHLRNAISIFQKNVFKLVSHPNISKTPRSSEMWTSLNNVVALDRQQPILSESMLEKIHDRRTITKIQSATEGYKRNLSLHGSPWWTSYCVGSIHWFVCGMLVVVVLLLVEWVQLDFCKVLWMLSSK